MIVRKLPLIVQVPQLSSWPATLPVIRFAMTEPNRSNVRVQPPGNDSRRTRVTEVIGVSQNSPRTSGTSDRTAQGGHLMSAQVRPTLEVIVMESAGELRKSYAPLSKLDLIRV